ncbi:MAG: RNA-binding protein [Acidobacteria bacterium]|nr:RNA-binding protein [Acidobacteriota bacterium]MBI3281955.1 RNA-binding protein [Acidobacteriota bacterium]
MKNIYVGNLSFSTTQEDLESLFGQFGQVERVHIVRDRDSGQPRGFAFVEMVVDQEGDNAIQALNRTDLHGRTLTVNEARPRPADGRGGGGFQRQGRPRQFGGGQPEPRR